MPTQTSNQSINLHPSHFKNIDKMLIDNGITIPSLQTKLYSYYTNLKAGERILPNASAVTAAIEAAKYLGQHGGSKLSRDEVILTILKSIMKIHCSVLYAKDIIDFEQQKPQFISIRIACQTQWRNICTSKQHVERTYRCIIR